MTATEGWTHQSLGEITTLVKGISYSSSDYCGPDEGAVFLTIKCVAKTGGFKKEGVKYYKGKIREQELLKAGDLLIANTDLTRDGDIVGCPVLVPDFGEELVTMSMDLSKLIIDTEKVDGKFLYFKLMTEPVRRFMQDHASGSTVLHLQTRAVPTLSLLIPVDKREQTKIATILSTLDRAIEQTEAIIAKQQRIKAGLMQDLLTKGIDEHGVIRSEATHEFKDSPLGRIPVEWEVRTVGAIFTMQLGKMLSKKAVEGKAPFPYLGNKNVQWDYVDLSELLEMDFSERERIKFELLVDDILVCEGGEVGRTALWRGEHDHCYFQKAIHRLRPIEEQYLPRLFPRFMRHAISTGALLNFTSQTSIAHLTQEQLAALPITVPKKDEQERIIKAFDNLDESLRIEKAKLYKMQRLKTGLMHDLLTGTVRVI